PSASKRQDSSKYLATVTPEERKGPAGRVGRPWANGAWKSISMNSVPASQVPTYPNHDGFGGGLP
ncbi:MAG: hypothetical protein QOG42_2261, partial [Solirubrobacteraceae bacterium]|nr:hypothetical protein [Solirubrobacteraceae bacterium]